MRRSGRWLAQQQTTRPLLRGQQTQDRSKRAASPPPPRRTQVAISHSSGAADAMAAFATVIHTSSLAVRYDMPVLSDKAQTA